MNSKILFLSYRLGYENLLYWDPILSNIKKEFPNFRVFTAWDSLITKDGSVKTEHKLRGIKYYLNKNKLNQKLIFFPFPNFLKDILEYKPDIIILNEFNLANFYVTIVKKYIQAKLLLLVENDPYIGYPPKKKKVIRTFLRKYIANKSDIILTNNKLGEEYLLRELNVSPKKIITKPYLTSVPIHENFLEKRKNNTIYTTTKNKKLKLLYVGQLIERKGVIYLLKALKHLNLETRHKIEVDIIGDGPEKSKLEHFVKINNLNFIKFHGKIPFDKLSKFYLNADIFILPTLYDYRALVGFEAISYGCAIIDSIFDGARLEIVKEGKNGYLINPKDTSTFSNILEKLINNPRLLKNFKNYSKLLSYKYLPKVCSNNMIEAIFRILRNDIS